MRKNFQESFDALQNNKLQIEELTIIEIAK